jgi:hypothetical protein
MPVPLLATSRLSTVALTWQSRHSDTNLTPWLLHSLTLCVVSATSHTVSVRLGHALIDSHSNSLPHPVTTSHTNKPPWCSRTHTLRASHVPPHPQIYYVLLGVAP